MNQIEPQSQVLDLLQKFIGMEPLKELFWSILNYDRKNTLIGRRKWPESAATLLAEDPILLATAGNVGDFHVIYSRLAKSRLSLADERIVASRLLKDHPYSLFIFSDDKQQDWHFLNIKDGDDTERRRHFRRLTVGPSERMRTASEVIAKLDISVVPKSVAFTGFVIQQQHDVAFDIGPVQKDFFRIFADVYHKVADDIAREKGFESEAGRLAQLLLDRLLFLYFVQKKGWLNQEADYLYSRFKKCWRNSPKGDTFYAEVLAPLFLCLSDQDTTLTSVGAVPFLNGGLFEDSESQSWTERVQHSRLHIKNSTFKIVFEELLERFNFTVTEDTPLDVEVAIDPEMLGKIFESLILELEQDPDKDLRRITGSYYTPRAIVHFMCQQALKEYLLTQMEQSSGGEHKITALLDALPAEQLDERQAADVTALFSVSEAKALLQAIFDCRVCDPAVGSGAFPVGLLHEMVATAAKLDLIAHGKQVLLHRNYGYDLKKRIIERCLYGVDIQEQAVRLCELRLWLSLVVDYEVEPRRPFAKTVREVPPLPNLSYRIVRGDSLLERLFGHVIQLESMSRNAKTRHLIQSLQADKEAYFREGHTREKRRLELKILAKQADLAEQLVLEKEQSLPQVNLTLFEESAKDRRLREDRDEQEHLLQELRDRIHRVRTELERKAKEKTALKGGDLEQSRRHYFQTGDAPTFLWRVDFAEVFAERKGFDIVIGNPPYLFGGNVGISQESKDAFKRLYVSGSGKINLFALFIEKSLSLLAEDRPLAFIVPNTLLRVTSYDTIRELMIRQSHISMIVDLGAGMFDNVTMSTIILVLRKGKPPAEHAIDLRTSLVQPGRLSRQSNYCLPGFVINSAASETDLRVLRKLEQTPVRLGTLCEELIFGVVISGNREELVSSQPKRGWKVFLEGRDIERYHIRPTDKYLNYKPSEIHRPRSPRIFEAKEKLLIQRITGGSRPLAVAYDASQHYTKESINNLLLASTCPYSVTARDFSLPRRPDFSR